MNIEERVYRTIRDESLVDAGDHLLVGVSGGIDSSALLFLLYNLRDSLFFDLAVAHVNHGLRGEESERDQVFVTDLAGKYGVPCHVARVDVKALARERGISVQHAGREARYRYFEDLCRTHGYDKVAVAHNRDDQVETFLLRIVKGTGIRGLASIPVKRDRIIRPFLHTYRSEIETYVDRFSLPYVQDSSNLKDAYERNFIRNRITPLLEKLNPRYREKMLFLLGDLSSINALFDEEAGGFLAKERRVEEEAVRIGIEGLMVLHPEVRFRVLAACLSRLEPRFVPLRRHVGLVEKCLLSTRPSATVTLPHGIRAKRVYGDVFLTKEAAPVPPMGLPMEIAEGENELPVLVDSLRV